MVFATAMAAVLVGVGLVMYQRRDTQAAVPPPKPAKETIAPPPPPTPKPELPVPPPKPEGGEIVAHPPPGKRSAGGDGSRLPAKTAAGANVSSESEADIAAAWTKALAERDRAIASGNYPGARAVIGSFLAAHPGGAHGRRAQQELADTKGLIDAALEFLFKDAERAAAEKNYRLAVQRCTRIVASDPSGRFGAGARELMTRMDESTEHGFAEISARATAQIQAGQLDKAGETLEKALDGLGGTKWAERISAQQLQVLMARSFLRRLESARIKAAEPGKPVVVTLPGPGPGKKITGGLAGVSGLALELRVGLRSVPVPLKELTPDDLQSVLKALGLTENHVELAYLWLLLEKTAAAQGEVEQALLNPQQESAALRLVSLLPNQRNLHVYDFSKWQHQSDWDAVSGSWCTQNGRYVLESPDGGDTGLRPAAIGGPFPAKNAHISFDFELNKPGPGFFFAFELANEDNGAVSIIFSEKGLALHANLAGPVGEQDEWTAGPSHVDFSVKGDTVTAIVNGKKAKPLEVPGLSEFKGTIVFRVRESGCWIGNVVLRNAE
jgi:tetratricopeptide (TPR) repeat protein